MTPPERSRSRPVTPAYLARYAAWYLARFTCSRAHLETLLHRKIDRSVTEHGTDAQTAAGWCSALLDRLSAQGALDDAGYARGRAGSLLRRGKPPAAIRADLRQRGIDATLIDEAMATLDTDTDPEWTAAMAYARRRRLGPFRRHQRAERREKDLAALARAGFSYDIACRIIDAAPISSPDY